MSLESCRIVLSDGRSIVFGIEDKIFNKNRAQTIQLSGLGSPKLNINSSELVGGGRFVYGSFTDQREISFALTFPSIRVYNKYRNFLENYAMEDSLECSQGNEESLSLIFKSSSGATYKTTGFFNEVKTDLFTDDPILWANFVCFDDYDKFYYEDLSEDRNPEASIYLSPNEITPFSKPKGTYNGRDLFQKFYKFKDDWNPYGNRDVSAGEVRILFSDTNTAKFKNIKRVILDYFYDYDSDENKDFWFEIDNMGDYIHPETTHFDLRFLTKSNGYKDALVKCWSGKNAFGSSPLTTWVPLSITKTKTSGAEMENWSLRPNSKGPSGVWYGSYFVSSLPDNVRVWHYFDNPNYYNRRGYVRSIHDV